MGDRGITFSAPMVLALLEGRKTQTRRLGGPAAGGRGRSGRPSIWLTVQPGDQLYVREAFAVPSNWTGPMSQIAASCEAAGFSDPWAPLHYFADGERANWGGWREHEPGKKRSPRHMPRWASRLTLTVTSTRVQQVQDISEADAASEGVEGGITAFADLWDRVHTIGAWAANPEVIAIGFTLALGNIDTRKAQ